MRQETIKIYTFKELGAEAQQKAIQKYIEDIDWSIESESISEDFKVTLNQFNYPTDDIEWSLNNCQGDGVAFYGMVEGEDMDKVAERLLDEEAFQLYYKLTEEDYTINARIYRNHFGHHYSHHNTMEVEMVTDDIDTMVEEVYGLVHGNKGYDEQYEEIEHMINKLQSVILDDVKEMSKKLETTGYEIIDGIQDENHVREYLEDSDYEYLENGKQYF